MSDGIYGFVNLLRSGCALWDEPFISPDTADQTKLVLEGEPDIDIITKNRNIERFSKRVPIIITSNSKLRNFVVVMKKHSIRVFKFDFLKCINSDYFCKELINYCPSLNTPIIPLIHLEVTASYKIVKD